MKNGILERKDGEKLLGIYRAFNVDGSLWRRLMADELVTLYGVAQGIKKGEIQTVETLKAERIGSAMIRKLRRKRKGRTIRLRVKKE